MESTAEFLKEWGRIVEFALVLVAFLGNGAWTAAEHPRTEFENGGWLRNALVSHLQRAVVLFGAGEAVWIVAQVIVLVAAGTSSTQDVVAFVSMMVITRGLLVLVVYRYFGLVQRHAMARDAERYL